MIPNMAAAMMHGLSGGVTVTAVIIDGGNYYGFVAPGGPTSSRFGESGGALSETVIPGLAIDSLIWQNDGYNSVYVYVAGNQPSLSFTSIKIGSVVVPYDATYYLSGPDVTEILFYDSSPAAPLPMAAGVYTVRLV